MAGYKIIIQKLVAFLHTNNEISERELKNQSHLKSHQKKIPRFRNKPDQGCERLKHWELWNIMEIEDDSKKWRDIPCSWTGRN